jgi:hypothetical protein
MCLAYIFRATAKIGVRHNVHEKLLMLLCHHSAAYSTNHSVMAYQSLKRCSALVICTMRTYLKTSAAIVVAHYQLHYRTGDLRPFGSGAG